MKVKMHGTLSPFILNPWCQWSQNNALSFVTTIIWCRYFSSHLSEYSYLRWFSKHLIPLANTDPQRSWPVVPISLSTWSNAESNLNWLTEVTQAGGWRRCSKKHFLIFIKALAALGESSVRRCAQNKCPGSSEMAVVKAHNSSHWSMWKCTSLCLE